MYSCWLCAKSKPPVQVCFYLAQNTQNNGRLLVAFGVFPLFGELMTVRVFQMIEIGGILNHETEHYLYLLLNASAMFTGHSLKEFIGLFLHLDFTINHVCTPSLLIMRMQSTIASTCKSSQKMKTQCKTSMHDSEGIFTMFI